MCVVTVFRSCLALLVLSHSNTTRMIKRGDFNLLYLKYAVFLVVLTFVVIQDGCKDSGTLPRV